MKILNRPFLHNTHIHGLTNLFNIWAYRFDNSKFKIISSTFLPLISSIQPELNKLRTLYLSWSGRLAAYKMLILPGILYYFKTLTIFIPASFFKMVQSQLHKFVCAEKKIEMLPVVPTKTQKSWWYGASHITRLLHSQHFRPNKVLIPLPPIKALGIYREKLGIA